MRQTIFFKTGLAVLCGLMLTATGLWAGGASDEWRRRQPLPTRGM